jgi:hypothetical protein
MAPEMTFHQTGSAFFWAGFLLVTALGSGALLLGLLVLLQSAAPELLGRAAGSLRQRPVVSLGLGALVIAVLAGGAALGRAVPAAGAFSVATFAGLTLFGLAAASENLGRRVLWISGREGSRISHLSVGWLVLFASACVPYVGWFLVLPWGVATGLGSLVLAANPKR